MATYYCGIGGNDAADGTTWAKRRLTLNASEDLLAAGDTLYIGPGTYRELWTIDKSGDAGQPITAIGDYDGSHTDGVGGVVRITGSNDDLSATRATGISATSKNYRTFRGFLLDTFTTGPLIALTSSSTIICDQCLMLAHTTLTGVAVTGAHTAVTISNCAFLYGAGAYFTHTSGVDNTGDVVSNCLFILHKYGNGVNSVRVGGITVKNCTMTVCDNGVKIQTALTAGQTVTVNNCIFYGCATAALAATTVDEFVEDYNTIFGCGAARSNVNVGAHSITTPPLFDARWFFELVAGGNMLSPWDVASYSQLINVAGTSPTTTDMRGTSVQGTQREWGALEYDSTLEIEEGAGGGGAVSISPVRGWS